MIAATPVEPEVRDDHVARVSLDARPAVLRRFAPNRWTAARAVVAVCRTRGVEALAEVQPHAVFQLHVRVDVATEIGAEVVPGVARPLVHVDVPKAIDARRLL